MTDRDSRAHAASMSHSEPEAGGFSAHLEGVTLHAFIAVQQLIRASGVYRVLSGSGSGTLHFTAGTLIHADAGDLAGNAALREMLSWSAGELIRSSDAMPKHASVPLDLGQVVARAAVDRGGGQPAPSRVTGIRRRPDGNATVTAAADMSPPFERGANGAGDTYSPARAIVAAATPGTAAAAPRLLARGKDAHEGVHVLLTARGDIVESRGSESDALATRAAYVVRLMELIAEAMGAGVFRSLDARSPGGSLSVRRHADGHVFASQSSTGRVEHRPSETARGTGDGLDVRLARSAELTRALHSLRDIDGVYGSFFMDRDGRPLARELPPSFDDATLAEAGVRIARLWDVLSDTGYVESALIGFAEYSVFLRHASTGYLCVVVPASVNVLALRVASNWVAHHLAR